MRRNTVKSKHYLLGTTLYRARLLSNGGWRAQIGIKDNFGGIEWRGVALPCMTQEQAETTAKLYAEKRERTAQA